MKTKLTTIFKKSANTPPMWVCLLFALVISTNSWADVTAEWGDYVSPARTFPKEADTHDEIEGIRITRSSTLTSGYAYVGGRDSYNNYQLNDVGEYVEITLSSGTISSVQFCVWTANENLLKIRFCKESEYSDDPEDLAGEAYYVMHDAAQAGSGLQTINAPANAKSAHIYKDGATHWQCYLYRLIITASDDCASPETATFAAGGSGNPTGSAPSNISRCEGSTFTMPGAGTLTWFGHKFTGWKLNNAGDLITAGTSYTMPAGGASFTAQWEEYVEPKIAEWGDYGVPATDFPSSSSSSTSLNGIELAYDVAYSTGGVGWYSAHTYYWVFDDNKYCNITLASSYSSQVISEVSACVWYTGYGSAPEMYIQFYSSATCSDGYEIGTPQLITGQVQTASTLSTHVPAAAGAKSARIYSLGEAFMCRLIVTRDDACSTVTASFAKAGSETGNVPGNIEVCEDGSLTIPDAGTLTWSGHSFAGWNDGSDTYAAGASYTMGDDDVEFTAVWNPMTVPTVTNLTIVEAIDKTVPLSYIIPGLCDLSQAVNASGISEKAAQSDGYNNPSINYNSETNIVTAAGAAPYQWQYGAVFPIPTTSGIESITIDCQGTLPDGVNLWGGVIANEGVTYWHYDAYLHNYRPSTWDKRTFTLSQRYWNDGAYSTSTDIYYLGVFANAGSGNTENISFSVREARYHITGQEDIDHVVIVRKDGVDPKNPTDGTVLYNGTKSFYVDEDGSKVFGHTYHYAVFAVHADGTVSNPTITTHTVVATATCEVSFNIGEGTIGDAPTSVVKPANGTVTLPSIGTVYKPFYAFTGWKKDGSEEAPLAAGATYTVTAEDVTAGTISFTAQWQEDNTTIRIPDTKTFGVSNKPANINTISDVDFNNDGSGDEALNIQNTAAEWSVFIQPGYYEVSMLSAVWRYGMKYTLSLIDPLTDTPVKTFFTKNISRNQNQTQYLNDTVGTFDLTDLIKGKRYVLKIEDTWPDCYLRVHDINFNPVTPEEIASEVVLDANNTVTTGLTEVTDVDFPGDNDQSVKLYNKKMDWVVKIAKGYYNISLLYGATEYSTRVSVALIDPEGVEPTRWFCPDQTDRNGHYYYTSGSAGTPYHTVGEARYDLYDITPEKSYILRVHDEYDGSNELRVKNLTFSPVTPEVISNVTDTRLDATNTILPPTMETDLDIDDDSNVDNLMNLYNTNAEWLVTLQKGLYDVQLVYGAPNYGIKVAVKLIDPSGEEPDKVLSIEDNKDYYHKSNPAATEEEKATTPHHYISTTRCALMDVPEDKIYKVRVADVYPKCDLRVSHVLFTPIEPLQIPEETRLDASNVMVAPSIVDSRIDISNQQEAVWYATIDPHKFDITLTYFAEEGGTKVRFAIIPVGGDTIFRYQENKYEASNTTYTIPALDQDLTNISSGVYKIIVKDNYKSNGSQPQIISLTFSRSVTTHTRSGLRVGDFGTICLPYAVAAEDRNGAELFEIEEWGPNGTSLTLSQLDDDDNMVAGHPYIFQATAATATWSYYPEGVPAEASEHNGLIGSYVQALIPQNEDNYIIYNNKLYLVNSEAYVGENRAYIHKQDQVQPAPAYRRRVTLSVNGAQVITDIDQINDPAQMTKYIENGHLFIFREGKLYNAQGQLVK